MLESLSIKNFRCFKEFKIDSLSKINLITGKNNVGKTALLEAIFLMLGSNNADIPLRLNVLRGAIPANMTADANELWGWLFYNRAINLPIALACKEVDGNEHEIEVALDDATSIKVDAQKLNDMSGITGSFNKELGITYSSLKGASFKARAQIINNNIQYNHEPNKLVFPLSIFLPSHQLPTMQENAMRFSALVEIKEDGDILESLRIIEPRLEKLIVSNATGSAYLIGDFGTKPLLPLSYMGDGINKLLSILLSITAVKKEGCLLVDEIEAGFHYSVMPQVWQVISHLAIKLNVQIIATTHSLEFVRAASKINQEDVFRLYRLERKEDQIKAIAYNKEAFDTSIEFGWEVR